MTISRHYCGAIATIEQPVAANSATPNSVAEQSYRSLFEVPGFRQLVVSAFAARIATQMFTVLLVLFVLDTYHSPSLSGIVLLCSQLPGIVCSPLAGALLDRGAKTKLMAFDYFVGASSIALICALAVPAALYRPTGFPIDPAMPALIGEI